MEIITMKIKNQSNPYGGAYIKYMELIGEFLNRGWKVHHISPRDFTNIRHSLLIHYGIRDILIAPNFLPFSIQALMKFLSIQRKTKIDAVVTFSFLEGLLGVLFKILNNRIKVVVAIRGDAIAGCLISPNYVENSIYAPILKLVEKIVLNHSDCIIFVSEYDRNVTVKRADFNQINKTMVLYNNISSRAIALSKEPPIRLSQDKKILGYVGSLYAEGKGLNYLISAFHIIKQKIPESMLVIVGDGPDKDELISLVRKLDLSNDVIFTGFKKNPIAYMKGFDILILPSLHEGCSQALLEALCSDTPVLGSNIGGTPEVLGYKELLFNAADAESIASKVSYLFQNPVAYQEVVNLCKIRKNRFLFDWGEEVAKLVQEVVG
jgi:glycosyltransferase involved in cell wall biosynthesis